MEASPNVRLGKRKITARKTQGGSRQPFQPPSHPPTGGLSSASAIFIIFRDNFQAQRYKLFQGSVVYVVVEMSTGMLLFMSLLGLNWRLCDKYGLD